jgi:hypothetical protein
LLLGWSTSAHTLHPSVRNGLDIDQRVNPKTLISVDHAGYAREVYSVQGARVTLEPNRRWECTCKEHAKGHQCIHIQQAHVLREKRGAKRDEDTIELQLSAEELQELYIAASVEYTECPTNEVVVPRKHVRRHSRWAAVVAAVAVAGTSSGITYLATVQAPPIPVAEVHSPAPRAAPVPEVPPPPPVRFVNPFDATEVFELPAGMSENDARNAVAEFLLDRARARVAASAETLRGSGQAVHHKQPESATRLADRS